eukprot:gene14792-17486_t
MKLLIVLSLLLAFIAVSYCQKCTVTIEGNSFDLSPLMKKPGESENVLYYFNVCNNTIGTMSPCGNDSPAFKYNIKDNKCTSLGSGSEFWSLHVVDGEVNGLVLEYKGGDLTPKGKDRNHFSYVFHCNKTAGAGTPKIVEIGEYAHTVAHWESEYGCQRTPTLRLRKNGRQ